MASKFDIYFLTYDENIYYNDDEVLYIRKLSYPHYWTYSKRAIYNEVIEDLQERNINIPRGFKTRLRQEINFFGLPLHDKMVIVIYRN